MRVEQAVLSIKGIHKVSVNLLNRKLTVICEDSFDAAYIIKTLSKIGYKAYTFDGLNENKDVTYKERVRLIFASLLGFLMLILSMGPMLGLVLINNALLSGLLQAFIATIVLFLFKDLLINGIKALIKFKANMNSTVALGVFASYLFSIVNLFFINSEDLQIVLHDKYHLYFESSVMILVFVGIGKYFENKAKVKSTSVVKALLNMCPKSVFIKGNDNNFKKTQINYVKVNDIQAVYEGDVLAFDGIIIKGQAQFDESSLTGESLPISKKVGDRVVSASTLVSGYVEIKIDKIGNDTTLSKIISSVEDALLDKPKLAKIADTVSFYFVNAVLLVAFITFLVWYFVSSSFSLSLFYAVCVLVISCPCALGLATPIAVMVGSSKASLCGVLFKNARVIETLAKVNLICFDKTATLTCGKLNLLSFENLYGDSYENKALILSLEQKSKHAIAKSLVKSLSNDNLKVLNIENYTMLSGYGICATFNNQLYYFANKELLLKECKDKDSVLRIYESLESEETKGHLALVLFTKDKIYSKVILGDSLKDESKFCISYLLKHHYKISMLTGDSKGSADYIAKKLHIKEALSKLTIDDKRAYLKKQRELGFICAMVGDGINDTAALSSSNVGISLVNASEVAISASDVVLVKNNLNDLLKALLISKKVMLNIKQNLFWAFLYNILAIPVAAGALSFVNISLSPMLCALLMSLSSFFVVTNALTLRFINTKYFDAEFLKEQQEEQEENVMQKTIYIDGMSCNHCTALVKKTLENIAGVESCIVSLEDKKALITLNKDVSDDFLKSTITDLDFTVVAIK